MAEADAFLHHHGRLLLPRGFRKGRLDVALLHLQQGVGSALLVALLVTQACVGFWARCLAGKVPGPQSQNSGRDVFDFRQRSAAERAIWPVGRAVPASLFRNRHRIQRVKTTPTPHRNLCPRRGRKEGTVQIVEFIGRGLGHPGYRAASKRGRARRDRHNIAQA
eukprot:11476630-Alexandrium_andersonii.AAC.1